jgi:hypothetical protein
MKKSTLQEKFDLWLWWQYLWTHKVSLFFKRFEVPLLLASITRWMITLSLGVDSMNFFLLLVLVAVCWLVWLVQTIIKWWRVVVSVVALILIGIL